MSSNRRKPSGLKGMGKLPLVVVVVVMLLLAAVVPRTLGQGDDGTASKVSRRRVTFFFSPRLFSLAFLLPMCSTGRERFAASMNCFDFFSRGRVLFVHPPPYPCGSRKRTMTHNTIAQVILSKVVRVGQHAGPSSIRLRLQGFIYRGRWYSMNH